MFPDPSWTVSLQTPYCLPGSAIQRPHPEIVFRHNSFRFITEAPAAGCCARGVPAGQARAPSVTNRHRRAAYVLPRALTVFAHRDAAPGQEPTRPTGPAGLSSRLGVSCPWPAPLTDSVKKGRLPEFSPMQSVSRITAPRTARRVMTCILPIDQLPLLKKRRMSASREPNRDVSSPCSFEVL